jgi:hypothetical protein
MMDKKKIIQIALQVGCTEVQAEEFYKLLQEETLSKKRFSFLHILYYLGGLIVFCSLVWFLGEIMHLYGKTQLFFILLAYVAAFYVAGVYLWKSKRNQTLGGLFCFLSLSLVPFTTYAFQAMIGWWPASLPGEYLSFYSVIQGGWFLMEVTTLTLTAITLRFIRFPLLSTVLYLTLWFMALDILPFFTHLMDKEISMNMLRKGISIFFGSTLMTRAFFLDKKLSSKEAFWAYLLGVSIFWSGISLINYQTEVGHLTYCLLNIALLVASSFIHRRVFLVFGVLGVLNYLVQLMIRHFSDSSAFPIVLSFAGLGVIALGMLTHRYGMRIIPAFFKRP